MHQRDMAVPKVQVNSILTVTPSRPSEFSVFSRRAYWISSVFDEGLVMGVN